MQEILTTTPYMLNDLIIYSGGEPVIALVGGRELRRGDTGSEMWVVGGSKVLMVSWVCTLFGGVCDTLSKAADE